MPLGRALNSCSTAVSHPPTVVIGPAACIRLADIIKLIILTPEASWDSRCGFDTILPFAKTCPSMAERMNRDGVLVKTKRHAEEFRRLRGFHIAQRFVERCCPQQYSSNFFDQAVQCETRYAVRMWGLCRAIWGAHKSPPPPPEKKQTRQQRF